jgi:hypothetical protein
VRNISTVARTWAGFRAFFGSPPGASLIQGQIRHQPSQSGILLPQVPELPDLGGHQLPKLLFPAVKGLLADNRLPGDLGHLGSLFGLLQGKGNLLPGKSGPLHRENSPCQIFH